MGILVLDRFARCRMWNLVMGTDGNLVSRTGDNASLTAGSGRAQQQRCAGIGGVQCGIDYCMLMLECVHKVLPLRCCFAWDCIALDIEKIATMGLLSSWLRSFAICNIVHVKLGLQTCGTRFPCHFGYFSFFLIIIHVFAC
jgi:hypothetical protein